MAKRKRQGPSEGTPDTQAMLYFTCRGGSYYAGQLGVESPSASNARRLRHRNHCGFVESVLMMLAAKSSCELRVFPAHQKLRS
jgi:hypothetical protein